MFSFSRPELRLFRESRSKKRQGSRWIRFESVNAPELNTPASSGISLSGKIRIVLAASPLYFVSVFAVSYLLILRAQAFGGTQLRHRPPALSLTRALVAFREGQAQADGVAPGLRRVPVPERGPAWGIRDVPSTTSYHAERALRRPLWVSRRRARIFS